MEAIERFAERVARSDSTALLTGETGTGKEVLARLIHLRSERADRAFVPVNCGAIPESLVESELFGSVRGAFTGATTSRKGRVAYADGGTLFLDEIGDLPLNMQVKLLRLLQEHTYEPVGSSESVYADFRLIAATHRDLAAEVEAGRFRRDLYYRLLVCPIEVPALRDRPSDIPVLFQHFWAQRGETRPVDPAVYTELATQAWRGNIRELENLVERVSVCSDSALIRVSDLPISYRGAGAIAGDPPLANVVPLRPVVEAAPVVASGVLASTAPVAVTPVVESVRFAPVDVDAEAPIALVPTPPSARLGELDLSAPVDLPLLLRKLEDSYIDAALARVGGNRKAAADLLGLQRTTLVEKLRRRTRDVSIP